MVIKDFNELKVGDKYKWSVIKASDSQGDYTAAAGLGEVTEGNRDKLIEQLNWRLSSFHEIGGKEFIVEVL